MRSSVAFNLRANIICQGQESVRCCSREYPKQNASAKCTSLYQFDKKGTLTNSYSLPQNVDRYRTLEDLLKSDNATSTCKNPKPTPPPGCVLCDNGQCLCTKFKFKGVE